MRVGPADPPAAQLGFVAAVALFDALSAWAVASRLALKWPNDLLLDGKKLSGILLERAGDAVVVGFGVNLVDHPDNVEQPAISLDAAGIAPTSPEALLAALSEGWAEGVRRWRADGFAPVREAWIARAHKRGTALAARLADGEILRGGYDGIDPDGALLLRLGDGATRVIHAGDIFAL